MEMCERWSSCSSRMGNGTFGQAAAFELLMPQLWSCAAVDSVAGSGGLSRMWVIQCNTCVLKQRLKHSTYSANRILVTVLSCVLSSSPVYVDVELSTNQSNSTLFST
jgi:hypothetical protein